MPEWKRNIFIYSRYTHSPVQLIQLNIHFVILSSCIASECSAVEYCVFYISARFIDTRYDDTIDEYFVITGNHLLQVQKFNLSEFISFTFILMEWNSKMNEM